MGNIDRWETMPVLESICVEIDRADLSDRKHDGYKPLKPKLPEIDRPEYRAIELISII